MSLAKPDRMWSSRVFFAYRRGGVEKVGTAAAFVDILRCVRRERGRLGVLTRHFPSLRHAPRSLGFHRKNTEGQGR